MNADLARLERIFREVLDDPGLTITPEFSPADHAGWDSVASVQIVLAAEQEFSCRLPTEAVAGIKNIADILRHLPEPAREEDPPGGGADIPVGSPARAHAEALLDGIRSRRDLGDSVGVFADLRLAVRLFSDYNFLSQAARV